MKLDVHSRMVAESTLQKTERVLQKSTGVEFITFELLPEAYTLYEPQQIRDHIIDIKNKLNLL